MTMFQDQWNAAVNDFTIVQFWADDYANYVHAEAKTGSKYEVLSTFAQADWRNKKALTCFVAVANPWERVWTTPWQSWAYPDYVREHWGSPHRSYEQMHGGDLAAVTMCVNLVLGHSVTKVMQMASEWGGDA